MNMPPDPLAMILSRWWWGRSMPGNAMLTCALVGLLLTAPLGAADGWVYPTLPGTDIRDYQAEPWRTQGAEAHPVYPGTDIRRYGAPERLVPYAGRWYRALPGSAAPDVRQGDFRGAVPRPATP